MAVAGAQFRGERDQVVVVRPDDVVGLQEIEQRIGEAGIDAAIAVEIGGLEFDEVETVVADRPEHLIGEADIIVLIVFLGQRDGRDGDAALLDRSHAERSIVVDDRSVPAEPDAPGLAKGIAQRNGKTSRFVLLLEIGNAI